MPETTAPADDAGSTAAPPARRPSLNRQFRPLFHGSPACRALAVRADEAISDAAASLVLLRGRNCPWPFSRLSLCYRSREDVWVSAVSCLCCLLSPSQGRYNAQILVVSNMKASEARRLISTALGDVFGPAGFVYRKSDEAFVRTFVGRCHFVHVGFWSYPPSQVFSLAPAVRIDAIEELCNDISSTPPRYRQKTASLRVQIWKLAGMEKPVHDVPLPGFGSPFYYAFSSEHDVSTAVNSVDPVVHDLVLPFFDQYCDIASVNRAINHEGLDTSNGRILHGLIAAHLARDPEYLDILSRYQKEMEAWPANDRELFRKAVEYLATHPA